MSASAGKNGSLLLDGYELATVISWGVELSIASHDQTPVNSKFARHKTGLQQWSLTIEGVCDIEDQGTERIVVGASVDIELYPGGDDYDQRKITGTATITSLSDAGSSDSILTFSAQLQGQGELKREAQQYLGIFNAMLAGFAFAGGGQYAADDQGILRKAEEDSPAYPGGYWDSDAEEWRPGSNVGVLLEDERTNVCLHSGDLNATGWTDQLVTSTDTGERQGDIILWRQEPTGSGGSGNQRTHRAVDMSGWTDACMSMIVRKGTAALARMMLQPDRSIQLRWSTLEVTSGGGVIAAGIIPLDADTYMLWGTVDVTSAEPTTAYISACHYAELGEYGYVGAPQIEAGSFTSSYIPTEATPVTRPATDMQQSLANLGLPDLVNDFCGQIVFTLNADFNDLPDNTRFLVIDAGGVSGSRLEVYRQVTNTLALRSGGADLTSLNVAPATKGALFDVRFRKSSATGITLWARGQRNNNATIVDLSPPAIEVNIGQRQQKTSRSFITAHKLRIVPEALSDAEIESWS